jgi:hypothetical protein
VRTEQSKSFLVLLFKKELLPLPLPAIIKIPGRFRRTSRVIGLLLS